MPRPAAWLTLSVLLAGCASDGSGAAFDGDLDAQLVHESHSYSLTEPSPAELRAVLYTTQEAWDGRFPPGGVDEQPAVDFGHRVVIELLWGAHGHTGHALRDVTVDWDGRYVVHVELHATGDGCAVGGAVTTVLALVAVDRVGSPTASDVAVQTGPVVVTDC